MIALIKERYTYKNGGLYHKKSGERAGCVHKNGSRRISIGSKLYLEHRLVWIMHNGLIPEDKTIDHINRDRLDNRIENLRLATKSMQQHNSNAKGFSWDKKNKKFFVNIKSNSKCYYVGRYDNELDARAAYLRAKEVYHYCVN